MPTVPIYNGPQVQRQALQPVFQQNVDTTKSTRALAAGLNDVAEVADQIDLRDSQAKAYAAESQITTEWLKWDKDARSHYVGERVDGYAPAAEAWWKSAADTYGKDLTPRAKALASRGLVAKQTSALNSVLAFTGAEKNRHADEVANANISSTIQFGITTGDVAGAAEQVREMTAQIGGRKGWTTEQLQAATTQQLGQLHSAQIGKLASTDPAAAQTYYDEAKARNEIPFAAQAKIEEVLKAEGDNQFATTFAAKNAALPLDEQLKAAGEITDPKRREKSLMQIKNNYAMVKEAQRAQEEKFADQAWQLVGRGARVPEAVLAGMDGKERVQLQEHLRAKADRGPVAPKTNPADHARLIDMMLNDPEAFKKERLAAAKLSSTDLEQFAAKQQALRAGGGKQDSMLTDEARVSNALISAGIDAKKNPEAATAVRVEVDRRVRAASADKGDKPLTPDEKQKVVDSVLVDKVFVDEWGRDPEKPVALLKDGEIGKAYVNVGGKPVKVSTVPSTDRAQIIAALRKRGLPVTEQAIVETYLRKNAK